MSDSENSPPSVGGGGPRVRPPQENSQDSAVALAASLRAYAEMDAFRDRRTFESAAKMLEALAAQLTDLRGENDRLADRVEALERVVEHVEVLEADLLALRGAGAALPSLREIERLVQSVVDDYEQLLGDGVVCSGNLPQPLLNARRALHLLRDGANQQEAEATARGWAQFETQALKLEVARLRSRGQALQQKWREKGAVIATYHATMGMGWTACADELLAALLTAAPTS